MPPQAVVTPSLTNVEPAAYVLPAAGCGCCKLKPHKSRQAVGSWLWLLVTPSAPAAVGRASDASSLLRADALCYGTASDGVTAAAWAAVADVGCVWSLQARGAVACCWKLDTCSEIDGRRQKRSAASNCALVMTPDGVESV